MRQQNINEELESPGKFCEFRLEFKLVLPSIDTHVDDSSLQPVEHSACPKGCKPCERGMPIVGVTFKVHPPPWAPEEPPDEEKHRAGPKKAQRNYLLWET